MIINKYHLWLSFLIFSLPQTVWSQGKMVKIDGGLQIGDPNLSVPPDGTIRWSGSDYEGWINGEWVSLTKGATPPTVIPNTVYDNDGNKYLTVTIGTQIWMRENLRTTTFNDSTIIPEANLSSNWNSTSPAWSWYHNDHSTNETYGKLYNGYVVDMSVNGNKNVCPVGWHVPTDEDWTTLIDFLEGAITNGNIIGIQSTTVGGLLKLLGTRFWLSPNQDASNESGFTALPGGLRNPQGGFGNKSQDGFYWSATENGNGGIYVRQLNYDNAYIFRKAFSLGFGFSIRCIKD